MTYGTLNYNDLKQPVREAVPYGLLTVIGVFCAGILLWAGILAALVLDPSVVMGGL